jgi:hypothetical protein
MKLTFKEIEIRNFLSFGNVPQKISLDKVQCQTITGYNRDKSDSNEDKNGIGKCLDPYTLMTIEVPDELEHLFK